MIRILLFAFCLLGPVLGEETTVDELVPGLISEEFKVRKETMKKLEAYAKANPEESITEILPALKKMKDPEGRARLLNVLKGLKMKNTRSLFGFTFFLVRNVLHEGKPVTGISISSVMPGTAASRDGLIGRDLILAVNGKTFPPNIAEIEARKIFAEQTPEKKVSLLVKRQGKNFVIKVSPTEEELDDTLMMERLHEFDDWLEKQLAK